MFQKRRLMVFSFLVVGLLVILLPVSAFAQEPEPTPEEQPQGLVVYSSYPSLVVGLGESVSYDLKFSTDTKSQIVALDIKDLPEGWTATFRGGGKVIHSVYVKEGTDSSVSLRLEPPAAAESGTYQIIVQAQGEGESAEFPLEVTIKEKLPPAMSFTADLPTLRGTSDTTFRFNATLKNKGDEDLTVNLSADAPDAFLITFKLSGQEVTTVPLDANATKKVTIQAKPLINVPVGSYPLVVTAQAEESDIQNDLSLTAEVVGKTELRITAPDGRLSGEANAGKDSPLKIVVKNNGTTPARGVELSSTAPKGWNVTFSSDVISEIPAGGEVDVTANIRPPEKAIAGDYLVTVRAKPVEGSSQSAEFRITVTTSTLWGIAGIALIAVAVGVVALAVIRFGRR